MKSLILTAVVFLLIGVFYRFQAQADTVASSSVYDFTVKTIDGQDKKLGDYKGKVLLIVNTASHCGPASYTSSISPKEPSFVSTTL